jgi:hypothetical protein
MAITFMTSRDKDGIRPHLKGLEHMENVNPPGTRHHDDPDVRRVLQAHGPRQIGAGIGTPAAQKTDNLGRIFRVH